MECGIISRLKTEPSASRANSEFRANWIAVATFSILSLYCGLRSQGFVAADACTHYLYSRFAFQEPARFVDVWARPVVTALYAIPASLGGRVAVRVLSLLVALACGWVAMRIAVGQRLRWPVLALIFTLGQPLLFLHSLDEMTELPFALLLGGAFLAYQNRRFALAGLLAAWLPLTRPEGFGFLAIMAIGLLYQRRLRWLLLLPIPLVLWDIAGWSLTPHVGPWWRWLIDAWPYAAQSMYGRGHPLTFLAELPTVVSPLVLPATLLGIGRSVCWRVSAGDRELQSDDGNGNVEDAHARQCRMLTAAIPVFVLVVHSLLYWIGRLASFGEARYLLVAAPFWGVLSARGWAWAFARLQWRHPLAWAGAAVLAAPIIVNFVNPTVPVPLPPDWQVARRLATWYNSPAIRQRYPRIMAAHPGLFYFLDLSAADPQRTRWWEAQTLANRPRDTLLICDPIYAARNASATRALMLDQIRAAGWVEVPAPSEDASWHVFRVP